MGFGESHTLGSLVPRILPLQGRSLVTRITLREEWASHRLRKKERKCLTHFCAPVIARVTELHWAIPRERTEYRKIACLGHIL